MLFSCHDRKPNYFISCGSLIVSGEHGISYKNKEGLAFTLNLLPQMFDAIAKSAGDAGICAWAVKDFFDISTADQHLYNHGFSKLPMDPEMIFYVRPEWNTFTDYLQALSAKYRLKANNVLKKLEGLEVKILSDADVERYKEDMVRLYLQVQQRSTVRLVRVNEAYFTLLKKKLKDRFYIHGFFKESNLIAFTCGLVYSGNHEAHFIGIDYSYNRSHQLYQNILYRFIHDAIERKSTRLYFGRTAMEMKTTVGAKAYDLHSYFKLDNSFLNKMAKPVINRAASPEWVPRSPFKEGN